MNKLIGRSLSGLLVGSMCLVSALPAVIAGDAWRYFGKTQEGQEVYLSKGSSYQTTVRDRFVVYFTYKLVDKDGREYNRDASTYDCYRPDGQRKGRPVLFDVTYVENGVTRKAERKAESDAMRNLLINACRIGWASLPPTESQEPSPSSLAKPKVSNLSTQEVYDRIYRGMSDASVIDLIGFQGNIISEYPELIIEWVSVDETMILRVTFLEGKVTGKRLSGNW